MLQENNKYKVLKVFFDCPTEKFGLREISRKINLGLPSVKKYLENLEKEKLIIKQHYKGKPVYCAEFDSEKFRFYKKISIQYELFQSGLIDFIWKQLSPEAIVLFGSYWKGESTEQSDIDLFVVSKKKQIDLSKYQEIFGREIHLMVFETNKIPSNLKSNLINGIVLKGFLNIK